jgi:spore coat protein CotH
MNNILHLSKYLLVSVFLFANALVLHAQSAIWPNNGSIFDDKVHRIDIFLPADSWTKLNKFVWDNVYFSSSFIYDNKDTLRNIGIRVKGNTSREAKKKGYRIDISEFQSQTYQGLKNMNLNGNHNDPALMREYLSSQVLERAGIIAARCNQVALYVNGTFQGLRNHSEYIDKIFLSSRFGENSGNLYKCSWPADLSWLGSDQQAYKNLINPSPLNERAYELKTNTGADNYSDLVELANVINNSAKDSFESKLEKIFDVNSYLKVLAAEVLLGHWDNYFHNKNNYFLYHRKSDNRFVYIPYDMDNTFGVQWGVADINKRNIHAWGNLSSSKAPLTHKILEISRWKMTYEQELRNLIAGAYHKDSLFAIIDQSMLRLSSHINIDPYYTGALASDYGFTVSDWQQSDSKAWGKHVSFGIKPFIGDRSSSALQQMIYPAHTANIAQQPAALWYPNPAKEWISNTDIGTNPVTIYKTTGQKIAELTPENRRINVTSIPNGVYLLEPKAGKRALLLIRH